MSLEARRFQVRRNWPWPRSEVRVKNGGNPKHAGGTRLGEPGLGYAILLPASGGFLLPVQMMDENLKVLYR